jgi:hypothetical protein
MAPPRLGRVFEALDGYVVGLLLPDLFPREGVVRAGDIIGQGVARGCLKALKASNEQRQNDGQVRKCLAPSGWSAAFTPLQDASAPS